MMSRERYLGVASKEQPKEWLTQAEKLIDYNESIVKKANRIFDLLPTRVERRHDVGDPPVSEEFRAILEVLESGCTIVIRVNGKLRTVIIDEGTVQVEEISEEYWEALTHAIEQWQPRFEGSYYMHGLLEVAVIANEIKWATRQAKILLQESVEAEP